MKCFVVLSCLLAVAYGGSMYATQGGYSGGYSGGRFAQASQMSKEVSQSASSNYNSASSSGYNAASGSGFNAAGADFSNGGYGLGSAGYRGFNGAASSLQARNSAFSEVEEASSSSSSSSSDFAAGSAYEDASYGASSLGGVDSYGAGAGYGSYGSGIGGPVVNGPLGGAPIVGGPLGGGPLGAGPLGAGPIGGIAGSGLSTGAIASASGVRQSSSSSSSLTRSYSASSSSSFNYQEAWQGLYQVPLFQKICGLKSTYKSTEYASAGLIQQNIDYSSVFNQFYSKNDLLQKYIYTATGCRYSSATERTKFFSILNQNPLYALRAVNLFARNHALFTSPFGKFLYTTNSMELLNAYQSSASSYSYQVFSRSQFLNSLLSSKYYSRTLYSYFGCSAQEQLLAKLAEAYNTSPTGTLLFLRHVLARRQLLNYNNYISIRSASFYRQSSFYSQKLWRHNPYYSSFYGSASQSQAYLSRQSSSSSSSSSSFRSSQAQAAQAGMASSGIVSSGIGY